VKMIPFKPAMRSQQVSPQEVIRNGRLGNTPKYDVLIALVKQPILRQLRSLIIEELLSGDRFSIYPGQMFRLMR
jgi:hypothetical protein